MYQIEVSIWLALEFLVRKRLADSVELEPLEGEDLEILRRHGDEDTSRSVTRLDIGLQEPRRYIIQTKSRRAGHWSTSDLLNVIRGTGKTGLSSRHPPIDVLSRDSRAVLLFVTNTTIQDELTWFIAGDTDFTTHTDEPTPAAKNVWTQRLSAIDVKILSRVGVLHTRTFEQIGHAINEILARDLNVPYSSRDSCHEALQTRFREAMLDEQPRVSHGELRAIAQANGGLPEGPSPFDPPGNWDHIKSRLDTQYALILCGEQGTGKTTLADALIYELQKRPEPFRLVPWKAPDQILSTTTEPTLIYAPDPFGQYEPRKHADEWAKGLSALCAKARADFRILVTTPEAFAGRYLNDPTLGLGRFRLDVDGSMFNGATLLDEHIRERAVAPEVEGWIRKHKPAIIHGLDRPFCYHVLINLVESTPTDQRTDECMQVLIRQARDAYHGIELENVFLRNGEPESIVAGLAAVWMALESWPQEVLSTRLTGLENLLIDTDPLIDVRGAVTLLRKYQMVKPQRSNERMHPIYLKRCLEIFREQKRMLAMRVSRTLLEAYLSNRKFDDVFSLLRFLKGKDLLPPSVMARAFTLAQSELSQSLQDIDRGSSRSALTVIALTGDPVDPVVLLAAYLFQIHDDPDFFDGCWAAPGWSTETRARITACPDTPTIVRAFLRQHLFTGFLIGAAELVDFLYGLLDVSSEFDALSHKIEEFHDSFSREVIIRGAAQSRNTTLDKLVHKMLAGQQKFEEWSRAHYAYDEDVEQHTDYLVEIANEFRSEVDTHADAILDRQERAGNPAWAATRSEPYVFVCYGKRVTTHTDEEAFQQVFNACPPNTRADLLLEVRDATVSLKYALRFLHTIPPHRWRDLFAHYLQNRRKRFLSEAMRANVRQQVAACLENLPISIRIGLAYDFHAHGLTSLDDIFIAQLTKEGRLALDTLKNTAASPPGVIRGLLLSLAESNMSASDAALHALTMAGEDLERLIPTKLESDRPESVRAALNVVSLTPAEKRVQYASIVLAHDSPEIRKQALRLLKSCPGDLAISEITPLIYDHTGSVRLEVVKALSGRSEPAAWNALLKLADDETDMSEDASTDYAWKRLHRPEYRIADAAKRALLTLEPKSVELIAALDQRFGDWRSVVFRES